MALSDDASFLIDSEELEQDLQLDSVPFQVCDKNEDPSNEVNEAGESFKQDQTPVLPSRSNENSVNEDNMPTTNVASETTNDLNASESQANEDGNGLIFTLPVYYSNLDDATVVNEPVIIERDDGTSEIQTLPLAQQTYTTTAPLRRRKIKLLQGFSVIAVLLFCPLGIPAMYMANGIDKEFNQGIMQGNIDKAIRRAKWSERFIFFSFMGALLVFVAVFAIVEREQTVTNYSNFTVTGNYTD